MSKRCELLMNYYEQQYLNGNNRSIYTTPLFLFTVPCIITGNRYHMDERHLHLDVIIA